MEARCVSVEEGRKSALRESRLVRNGVVRKTCEAVEIKESVEMRAGMRCAFESGC